MSVTCAFVILCVCVCVCVCSIHMYVCTELCIYMCSVCVLGEGEGGVLLITDLGTTE